MKSPNVCLVPSCTNTVEWKGICRSCHEVAMNEVNAGRVTWEELQAAGLCRLAGNKPMEAEIQSLLKTKHLSVQELDTRIATLEDRFDAHIDSHQNQE